MNVYANDFNTVVKTYYKELDKYKPIERDVETELIKKAKNNDIEARNKVISSNLRFVFAVAKKYKGKGADLEDLISEGNIGLLRAIERFDENRGVKFFTYAVWYIRQSILDFLEMKNKTKEYEEKIEENNYNERDVNDFLTDTDIEVINYDEKLGLFADEEKKDMQMYHQEIINKLLLKISPRGKYIIQNYYGLDNRKPLNLEEIGDDLGITKERVRQIKESSLRIIRSEVLALGLTIDGIFE